METLGRYRILGELGRGAMGVVYRAADEVLNRTVAIKTINVAADPQERAEYERRFYQEAKAAGSLNHPNIVTIYDLGQAGDVVYMAMEYIEGTELRELLQRGRLDLGTVIDILAQVADGLAFAHERGIVHRDVKPANIMVIRDGPAKVMDFGIARMRTSDVKTQTGMLLGSPKYMAPEHLLGGEVDQRCDIFSLGVVIYEAVTGAPPFSGADISQIMYQIVHAHPPAPSAVNRRAPPMLDLIIAKALAKEAAARYQHARELAADLRTCRMQLAAQPEPGEDADTSLTLAPGSRAAEHAATVKLEAPGEATPSRITRPGDAGPRLRLSRRFDSTAAMRRLAAMTGGEAPPVMAASTLEPDARALRAAPPGGAADRPAPALGGRNDRWIVAASVAGAAVLALFIAFG